MAKQKIQDLIFVVDVPPDEDTISRANKVIAEAYIKKYGVENMKRVLEELKKHQQ